MRHVTTIAATALVTAIISSWGTTMMVAHSAKNTAGIRIASQIRAEAQHRQCCDGGGQCRRRCPGAAGRRRSSLNRFSA